MLLTSAGESLLKGDCAKHALGRPLERCNNQKHQLLLAYHQQRALVSHSSHLRPTPLPKNLQAADLDRKSTDACYSNAPRSSGTELPRPALYLFGPPMNSLGLGNWSSLWNLNLLS